MELIFIKDDNNCIVDGRSIIYEYEIPAIYEGNLHVVMWTNLDKEYQSYTEEGFKNIPIKDDDYEAYIMPLWRQWEAQRVIEDTPLPEPTLDELKAQKKQEINDIRDTKEQSGFEYDGSRFDSDSVSYQRLIGANITASSALATGAEFTPILWTLEDNTTRLMSAQDFIAIIPVFATYSGQLHYTASIYKKRVDNATTKEELDLIIWE